MKKVIIAITGAAAVGLSGAAAAQQIAPVVDRAAGEACAPKDVAAALACLDQHLKPEVKEQVRAATAETIAAQEIYVGLWVRNGWKLWSGSDLSQFMVAHNIPQVERMSDRIVQAYWLKNKGCNYDWNNLGYTVVAITKARSGGDPCSVTAQEASRAFTATAARRGSADNEDLNPNQ